MTAEDEAFEELERRQAMGWRKRAMLRDGANKALVRLYRDEEGTVIHSERVQPLSDEEINKRWGPWITQYVRMVEAAHGIQ